MITISSVAPPHVRLYLDDELFIDQQLPWSTTKLTTDTEAKPKTMRIQNNSDAVINASVGDKNHYFAFANYLVQPGETVHITK